MMKWIERRGVATVIEINPSIDRLIRRWWWSSSSSYIISSHGKRTKRNRTSIEKNFFPSLVLFQKNSLLCLAVVPSVMTSGCDEKSEEESSDSFDREVFLSRTFSPSTHMCYGNSNQETKKETSLGTKEGRIHREIGRGNERTKERERERSGGPHLLRRLLFFCFLQSFFNRSGVMFMRWLMKIQKFILREKIEHSLNHLHTLVPTHKKHSQRQERERKRSERQSRRKRQKDRTKKPDKQSSCTHLRRAYTHT